MTGHASQPGQPNWQKRAYQGHPAHYVAKPHGAQERSELSRKLAAGVAGVENLVPRKQDINLAIQLALAVDDAGLRWSQ